ncbi:MAG: prepilin-type N-terminal cleavage/methylation domain-containing protein [Azoarcus sp.]|jgi:general secretion pathway protein I|nr:prepilin-type N-terminal cleavage/methylation domain-containing protein [Azoarcus sp.]
MKRGAKRRRGGFSLLEVVIAMAIMAMSLGALYRAGGGALRGVIEGEARTRATALALVLLDGQWSVPPGGLLESGSAGGMEWQLAAAPFQPRREKAWALHRIEASVTWDKGRRGLKLASLLPERRTPLDSEQQMAY